MKIKLKNEFLGRDLKTDKSQASSRTGKQGEGSILMTINSQQELQYLHNEDTWLEQFYHSLLSPQLMISCARDHETGFTSYESN